MPLIIPSFEKYLSGRPAGEELTEALDLLQTDWPAAIGMMTRLSDELGDLIDQRADLQEVSQPPVSIALAALEKGLLAYSAVLEEDDPVRLTQLVDVTLNEAAVALAEVDLVDAGGNVWDPGQGGALQKWLHEAAAPINAVHRNQPRDAGPIRALLEEAALDPRVRTIVEMCHAERQA